MATTSCSFMVQVEPETTGLRLINGTELKAANLLFYSEMTDHLRTKCRHSSATPPELHFTREFDLKTQLSNTFPMISWNQSTSSEEQSRAMFDILSSWSFQGITSWCICWRGGMYTIAVRRNFIAPKCISPCCTVQQWMKRRLLLTL